MVRVAGGRVWPWGARCPGTASGSWSCVARRRETLLRLVWLAVMCGPGAQDVPALRLIRGRVWPAGAKRSRVRLLAVVCGPGAQDVPALRLIRGRVWPRGAKRSRIPSASRACVARGRETYRPSACPAVMCGPGARKVPADPQHESTGTRSQRRPPPPPPIPPAAASPAVTVADEVAEPSSPLLDRPPTESPLAVPPR